MLFVLNSKESTVDEGRVQVYVYDKKKEAADSKKSNENIEPTLVTTSHFHHRHETVPKTRRIEKIGKDPDVIVEYHHKEVDNQSQHQNTDNGHEQNQRYKPNAIFQFKWPYWKQHQQKHCHNCQDSQPVSRLSGIETKRCEFTLRMDWKHWLKSLWVFCFYVVWSSKENELIVCTLHQIIQNLICLYLLLTALDNFLKLIDSEIFHPFVGDLRMRESQLILSEEIDKRSYACLVLIGLPQVGLSFSIHPLLVLLPHHFVLLARHSTNNNKRVFSIIHTTHHIITEQLIKIRHQQQPYGFIVQSLFLPDFDKRERFNLAVVSLIFGNQQNTDGPARKRSESEGLTSFFCAYLIGVETLSATFLGRERGRTGFETFFQAFSLASYSWKMALLAAMRQFIYSISALIF